MKIFVDFDRVAWDVDRLYELLPAHEGPQPGTMESLEYIKNEHGLEVSDLLFKDFVEFAQRQRAMGNELILVSSPTGHSGEWEEEYQKAKIEHSGIRELVDKVIVTGESKGAAIIAELKAGERGAFFEDNERHLHDVQRALAEHAIPPENFGLYQMLRAERRRTAAGVESVEAAPEFKQVKNFEQLDALLEGKKEEDEE